MLSELGGFFPPFCLPPVRVKSSHSSDIHRVTEQMTIRIWVWNSNVMKCSENKILNLFSGCNFLALAMDLCLFEVGVNI